MRSIHKSLILALGLLPLTLFSEGALAGGLKFLLNSGHHGGHNYHYSYSTRPVIALSYGRGGHYYGRHHYAKPYYHGYRGHSRSRHYGYSRHKYYGRGYNHGYHNSHRGHGGHKGHHGDGGSHNRHNRIGR